MLKNQFRVALGAVLFALIGFLLYRLQGSGEYQMMNLWGVVSFGFLGASFMCLTADGSDSNSSPFGPWF